MCFVDTIVHSVYHKCNDYLSHTTYTHSVSLLLSRTASPHTHIQTHTFLLVSLSCLRGTADTTTVLGFRAKSVPAQSVLLRLQQQGHIHAHTHIHTHTNREVKNNNINKNSHISCLCDKQ